MGVSVGSSPIQRPPTTVSDAVDVSFNSAIFSTFPSLSRSRKTVCSSPQRQK
jgi:hypothetical protein